MNDATWVYGNIINPIEIASISNASIKRAHILFCLPNDYSELMIGAIGDQNIFWPTLDEIRSHTESDPLVFSFVSYLTNELLTLLNNLNTIISPTTKKSMLPFTKHTQ